MNAEVVPKAQNSQSNPITIDEKIISFFRYYYL